MAKGKKRFLDYFRVNDDEEYDEETDDLFDDEDDDYDEDYSSRKKKEKKAAQPVAAEPAPRPQYRPAPAPRSTTSAYQSQGQSYTAATAASAASAGVAKKKASRTEDAGKLVSFDNQKRRNLNPSSEVYVIKPQEFDDAQTVTDLLKTGKTIVINMEGIEIDPAQRIIDFIGGACYGLGGDLRAISASIFIAAPNNIEVSGDLRDEILNDSTLSPELGKY